MTRLFRPKSQDDNKKDDPYYHYFRWVVCNNLRLDAAKGRWPEIIDPGLIWYNELNGAHIISINSTGIEHSYIESLEIFTRWNDETENSRVWCRLKLESSRVDDVRAKIETIHWNKLNRMRQVMNLKNIPVDHTKNDAYYLETHCLEDSEAAFFSFLDLSVPVLMDSNQ